MKVTHEKECKVDLSCTLRGEDFKWVKQLIDHSGTMHEFPCKLCGKESAETSFLTVHTNFVHRMDKDSDENDGFDEDHDDEEKGRISPCDLCEDQFLMKEQLNAHGRSAHDEPRICVRYDEDF